MHTERNRYLTESMGEKVRTVTAEKRKFNRVGGFKFIDFVCSCCDGPQSACGNYATDFSTYEGFGKLMSIDHEIVPRGYLRGASHAAIHQCTAENCTDEIPDRFANVVYDFLKSRESEEA